MSTIDAELPAAPAVPGPAARVLIVRAPYYRDVVDGLRDGAERILREAGAGFEVLDVAGAFELPQAIRMALRGQTKFDAFVALGCIVKGETDHYDFICQATMHGMMNLALQYGIAVGTGLLTVDTIDQAVARSGPDGFNKGAEAAVAALLQVNAARRFGA
jgi:6,7-dimethyl-8-ribityllumazine synthase